MPGRSVPSRVATGWGEVSGQGWVALSVGASAGCGDGVCGSVPWGTVLACTPVSQRWGRGGWVIMVYLAFWKGSKMQPSRGLHKRAPTLALPFGPFLPRFPCLENGDDDSYYSQSCYYVPPPGAQEVLVCACVDTHTHSHTHILKEIQFKFLMSHPDEIYVPLCSEIHRWFERSHLFSKFKFMSHT